MLKQVQSQKLGQKLSPQQILLMKLLQVPTIDLLDAIEKEIQENPALEIVSGNENEGIEDYAPTNEADSQNSDYDDSIDNLSDNQLQEDDYDKELKDFDITEYVKLENSDHGSVYNPDNDDIEDKNIGFQNKVSKSLNEYLENQLDLNIFEEKDKIIGLQIIGSIDDDGYLRRTLSALKDDLVFGKNLNVSFEEIKKVLQIIKKFDPIGIASEDLQECLKTQILKKLEYNPDDQLLKYALQIVTTLFDKFVKKQYQKLTEKLNIDNETLKASIDQIIKLNPKPGLIYGESDEKNSFIIPDFFVRYNNTEFEITLNSRNAPELRVSEDFKNILLGYDSKSTNTKINKKHKEAVLFVKQKLDSAKWFINSIKQRQHTLLSTMQAIVGYQKEYFKTGNEMDLKPMILKDIASMINLDISTISRVVNQKYVDTEFGIFKLKYFFSEAMVNEEGDEISNIEIKKILQEIIEQENKKKPLSDVQILSLLKDKGYILARRTVTKYREQLNIPISRLRKEL